MEQMTITAKIQIIAAEADKVLLDETMSVYRNACNYVSDYVFHTHDLKQFSLNKVLLLWSSFFITLCPNYCYRVYTPQRASKGVL